LRSQVIEAEAATSQKSKKSTTPFTATAVIEDINEEDEEEPYDSDLDELGW
jgi:hypothetical protein